MGKAVNFPFARTAVIAEQGLQVCLIAQPLTTVKEGGNLVSGFRKTLLPDRRVSVLRGGHSKRKAVISPNHRF
jgi:hypothetical protein